VTRKSINANSPVVSCDVCGRTLLRGEHADVFLHGGARRMVCELCTARAAHEGWIREGADDATVRSRRSNGGRGSSLLARLRSRLADTQAAAARDREPTPAEAWTGDGEPDHHLEPELDGYLPEPEPEPEPEPVAPPAPAVVAPAPREPRNVHAIPTNADLKMARALDLFNVSEHRRTVSGVARSLGAPIVAVRPSLTEGSVVTIVVAWELSWYRFEVDLANEAAGVRVTAQGAELSELEPEDQTPNAAADELGELHLVAQHA
jgi:hypothetical protein